MDYDYQRLRLMVELGDYNSGEAARELRFIQERGRELFPDAHVLLIGSISQFTVMQDYVTWGQVKSFFIALCVIDLLMTVVFGNLKTGLIGSMVVKDSMTACGGPIPNRGSGCLVRRVRKSMPWKNRMMRSWASRLMFLQ
ncbi:hypothetical protein [Desulfosarcina ovata]|uniref:hypothetical protein n=1 Tax=Desulfosarcina ovata TaxID=83564 RepID=UPI0012D2F62A|nr:hypothetical protein [Desulfosarcina ovata]